MAGAVIARAQPVTTKSRDVMYTRKFLYDLDVGTGRARGAFEGVRDSGEQSQARSDKADSKASMS